MAGAGEAVARKKRLAPDTCTAAGVGPLANTVETAVGEASRTAAAETVVEAKICVGLVKECRADLYLDEKSRRSTMSCGLGNPFTIIIALSLTV